MSKLSCSLISSSSTANVLCQCGVVVEMKTSWTQSNPGRFLPDLGFMGENASANATTTIDYHPLYLRSIDAPGSLRRNHVDRIENYTSVSR
ncbi:hypothetical protein H5410_028729 [Solanum commersonii]|uniref:Uncharacterized protein n=1 Tax=Solanum commersonii TaxID=4109 RepID=A0A9J5Z4U2_SOLCO|nr:hypothetical protein H5410_028729 [Solanum commersonii]